jgi:hypothetical protein
MGLTVTLGGAGGSSSLTVKDEGTTLSSAVTSIDVVGAALTATGTTAVTITSTAAEVLIEEKTPSGVSTVTFSSIPGTYRDLRLKVSGRGSASAATAQVRVQFNADTGSNYDCQATYLNQNNDPDAELRATTYILVGHVMAATGPSDAAASLEARIFDYRGTTFWKTVISQGYIPAIVSSGGFLYNDLFGGDWRSTSAVTSMTVFLDTGNYNSGCVVSLYGIL